MNEFSFEISEWEEVLAGLQPGTSVSAVRFLTVLEGEDDSVVEDAFLDLEERRIQLDCSDLPKNSGTGETARRLREEEQLARSENFLTALDQNDPLRLYLEELAAIPAFGDVDLLALELAEGNSEVQDQLMNLSLSRVVELAMAFTGHGVLLLDLIQEGSLGLWQGILTFRDGDFENCRDWWIRQYLAKAVIMQARSSGLGQKMRQAVEDYRMIDERLLSELGRNPTVEEIAFELHMTPEETETVRRLLENARMMGKAHTQPEPEEESPEDDQAVEDTAYYQTRERVDSLMSGLTELESRLLRLRYGLDGKQPQSVQETGRKLNLTAEEVVEMEAVALAKMRRSGE